MLKVIQRSTREEKDVEISTSQKFLYRSLLGRCFLKFLIRPFVSKLVGAYLSSRLSKHRIKKFVKRNTINTEDFVLEDIHSFNDFFSRKIKEGKRTINSEESVLISPCDSKLSVFPIEETSIFKIKDSYYRISELIKDESLAKEYVGGYCFIFRLAVDDYHRYCYVDDGYHEEVINIKGTFHTVNPIALERYNFFKTNHRQYTILHTKHFGDLIQVEVGAMMVGKIDNYHENYSFKKGEEKGKFLFGGSTIVLLTKNVISVDADLLAYTASGDEVQVSYGERIGVLK